MARNYNNDLFKHIEELLGEVANLKQEIKTMRVSASHEIAIVKNEMDDLKKAHKAEVKALTNRIDELEKENDKLRRDNNRMKSQLSKNSSNSSKPPSTNQFKRVANSREKSAKNAGGQIGHVGHRLGLPDNIEQMIEQGNVIREVHDHTKGKQAHIIRYELDIQTSVILREHRFSNKADVPSRFQNEVSYGDGLKAQTVLLTTEGLIARKRLVEIFSGLTDGIIRPSTGTIHHFLKEFNAQITSSGELDFIKDELLNAAVMHVDDTQIKTTQRPQPEGQSGKEKLETKEKGTFRSCLRTYSTQTETLFTVNRTKGNDGVVSDDVLPHFTGIISQDFEAKFRQYGSGNAFCHAHLDRELKGLIELYKCEEAKQFRQFFNCLNAYKKNDINQDIRVCDEARLAVAEAEYDQLLDEAFEGAQTMGFGQKEFTTLLKRLREHKEGYLLFMRDYQAPFTNNQAERDLRMEKQQQKVSGAHRSWAGAVSRANIRSILSTARKRGISVFHTIEQVFKKEPVFKS